MILLQIHLWKTCYDFYSLHGIEKPVMDCISFSPSVPLTPLNSRTDSGVRGPLLLGESYERPTENLCTIWVGIRNVIVCLLFPPCLNLCLCFQTIFVIKVSTLSEIHMHIVPATLLYSVVSCTSSFPLSFFTTFHVNCIVCLSWPLLPVSCPMLVKFESINQVTFQE